MATKNSVKPVIFLRPGEVSPRYGTGKQYSHLKCLVLVFDGQRSHPVNPSHWLGEGYQDLVISAQMDEDSCDIEEMEGRNYSALYGFDFCMEGSVLLHLRDMEAIVKVMRKVNRAVAERRFNRFADYVVAVGKAMGATYATADRAYGGSYDQYRWNHMTDYQALAWLLEEEQRMRCAVLEAAGKGL